MTPARAMDSFDIIRLKNRFKKPNFNGYRDALYNIKVDGMIVEVQLHFCAILSLNKESHQSYEFFRTYFEGKMESVKSRRDTLEILKDEFGNVDVETGLMNLLKSNDFRLLKTVADFSHTLGDSSLKVASCRHLLKLEPNNANYNLSLGNALREDGKYDKASPLLEQALKNNQKLLGSEHPDTLMSMNNLAGLYDSQGKYDKAEPLYKDCLEIRKKVLGSEHPSTFTSMNNLAVLMTKPNLYISIVWN